MKNRTKDTYKQAILSKFDEVKASILPEITPLSIKNRCIALLNEKLTEKDKHIVTSYFNSKSIEEVKNMLVSKDFDLEKFKSIQQFLLKKTSFRYPKSSDFTAFLINFEKRPYATYLQKPTVNSIEKIDKKQPKSNTKTKKNTSFKPLLYLGVLVLFLISIWIVKDLFKPIVIEKPQKIEITNYNGNLNYFYNLNDKGKIELYNKQGTVLNKPLKSVTKEILFTYFEQNKQPNTRKWTKENTYKKLNKPKKEQSKNIAINNTIIDIKNNGVADNSFDTYFMEMFENKKFTCKGSSSYSYRKSTVNKQLVVCDLILSYKITDNKTKRELESKKIHIIGSGFSELEAKQNTIYKLNLYK